MLALANIKSNSKTKQHSSKLIFGLQHQKHVHHFCKICDSCSSTEQFTICLILLAGDWCYQTVHEFPLMKYDNYA